MRGNNIIKLEYQPKRSSISLMGSQEKNRENAEEEIIKEIIRKKKLSERRIGKASRGPNKNHAMTKCKPTT